ncbi:hypothetical protein C0991_002810 [Blastosporella zonata]|nr:hypothetical protein C0991_002810 [Blastosporella zonata]
MPTDVFRPRLPLDPFHDAEPPWYIHHSNNIDTNGHTILILGAPSQADLAPLAQSPFLSSSLLLIATHTPPPLPDNTQCPVVILHLPTPLDIHDSGAVRLVALLERAQRVALNWHLHPNAQPRIQQLAELYPGGDFSISEQPEFALVNPIHHHRQTPSLSSSSSVSSFSSRASLKKSPAAHSFSAIINFLPAALPDKALLKHSILVTTLSAPFLGPPAPPPSPYKTKKRQSIFSSLSLVQGQKRRSRITSLFSSPPPSSYSPSLFNASRAPSTESLVISTSRRSYAHLVHVLPYSASLHPRSSTVPTPSSLNPKRRSHLSPHPMQTQTQPKSKLVQSIEQFLLSFAYPPTASASAPSLPLFAPPSTSISPINPLPISPGTHHAPVRSSPLASPSTSPGGSPSGSIRHAQLSSPPPSSFNHKRGSIIHTSSLHSVPTVPGLTGGGARPAQTIPFLLPAGTLGACPANSTVSVGEWILRGEMDGVASGAAGGADGLVVPGGGREGWPRAWIAGWPDVVVRDAEKGSAAEYFGLGLSGVSTATGASSPFEDPVPVPTGKPNKPQYQEPKPKSRSKQAKKAKLRRNEASLPTPPESSGSSRSSSSSSSTSSHDSSSSSPGSSDEHHHLHPHSELNRSYYESTPGSSLLLDDATEASHTPRSKEQRYSVSEPHYPAPGKLRKEKGVGLRTRVSRFFGRGQQAKT